MKTKLFLTVLLMAVGGMVLLLSGCFNMQSTLSYYFYNEAAPATPASIAQVYIRVKRITANVNVMSTSVNSTENILQYSPVAISTVGNTLNNSLFNNNQISIPSLSVELGPTATIVYNDGRELSLRVATVVKVKFYGYSNQQMQVQPLQVLKGQNKSVLIVWNLSALSTTSTSGIWIPSAIALDKDNVVKLSVSYPTTNQNTYYKAVISDVPSSFKFSAPGKYDYINGAYDFELYPFASSFSTGYKAEISIKTATQTVVSTTVTIKDKNITVTF